MKPSTCSDNITINGTLSANDIKVQEANISSSLSTRNLSTTGSASIGTSLVVNGADIGDVALTVNGGTIVSTRGITSYSRNNKFQALEITGSGTCCNRPSFKVDSGVDSLFLGDVVISGNDSKLIMDGSTIASDNIVVTPISQSNAPSTGIQLTTNQNWDDYMDAMVLEDEASESASSGYDPYASVHDAIERNRTNYENARLVVQQLVNPISYAMENADANVPKRFAIKNGIYRVDSNGNALLKNLVSEKGKFSELEAYKFNINKMNVDKLVLSTRL